MIMKPNLLKDKFSNIAVAEKEEQKAVITRQEQVNSKNFFSASTFTPQIEEPIVKPQPKKDIVIESQPKQKVNMFSSSAFESTKETAEGDYSNDGGNNGNIGNGGGNDSKGGNSNDEDKAKTIKFVDFSAKPKQKRKVKMFRFRLVTVVYCLIVAICTSWIITNSIKIAQISNSISQTQSNLYLNGAKLVDKIQELEDLQKSPETSSSLIPIDEIITIQPRPLEDPTEYEAQSNWFDSICNWFGNLFGG